MHCPHCNALIGEKRSFCVECGMLQKSNLSESVECENHAGEQAIGLCMICGKPVCGDCAVTSEGKIFCDNVQHQEMFTSWLTVHVSDFEFESDMIRQNLANAGMESKVFSSHDHGGTYWLPDVKLVRVMVPNKLKERALHILRDLHLKDNP